jgi:hypothetical protein
MINFVNEEQKQQVTCHWLLSLIAIYEKNVLYCGNVIFIFYTFYK